MVLRNTVILAITCSITGGVAVRIWDQFDKDRAVEQAYENGRRLGAVDVPSLKALIASLRSKVQTLISVEEAVNEQKDLQLDLAISRPYRGATDYDHVNALIEARRSQHWRSLKYRILSGQDAEVKPLRSGDW